MFRRLISAAGQSRSAKTVEVFGWLILFEGTIVLFAPHFSVSVLGISLALIFQFKTSAAFFGHCSAGVPNSQNRRGEFYE